LAVKAGRRDFFELDGNGSRIGETSLIELYGTVDGVLNGDSVDIAGDGGVERRDYGKGFCGRTDCKNHEREKKDAYH
jgi:hypothetical protein